VTEQRKPWGLRNIKLRFSRKLLYFGGVIVAAELAGLSHDEKLHRAAELFHIPVLDRIREVGGAERAESLTSIYEKFVASVSDPEIRDALVAVKRENRQESDEYQSLRSLSERFTDELDVWLSGRYKRDHPIHQTLIF